MIKVFKYRIYPTKNQSDLIGKHIDCCRFIYNLALETNMRSYSINKIQYSSFSMSTQISDLKNEAPWLNEVCSQSLISSVFNLGDAFNRFYRKQNRFPVFKKKRNYGSFTSPRGIKIDSGRLYIAKFREGISINLHRPYIGEIKRATIIKTATGKYFASVICKTKETIPLKENIIPTTSIGVDLGIKSFAVCSNGKIYDNPKFLKKSESKLKYIQRKYSKNKGKHTQNKLSLLHEKIANQRKDFLHKVSSELIRDNQSICIETLKVKNMLKNRKLSKSISDAGWSMFVEMLSYKAEWNGVNLLKIGSLEPSSKTCSICGNVNKDLKLKQRNWSCKCGANHDRDINAAINIKNFALSRMDRENQDELPALAGMMTLEAENAIRDCVVINVPKVF